MNRSRQVQRRGPSSSSSSGSNGSSNRPILSKMMDNKLYIVIAILLIACITLAVLYFTNESFANTVNDLIPGLKPSELGSQIKELDVVMFASPTCPWCKKMKDLMKSEGSLSSVTVVDVSSEEGQKMATEYGAHKRGIPSFFSKKLHTGTVGFKKEGTAQLIKELVEVQQQAQGPEPEGQEGTEIPQEEQAPVNPQDLQDLGIVLFMSETCPWCKKTKDEAENLGILPYLEMQDLKQGGEQIIQNLGITFEGVPLMYSQVTGKTSVGYKPWSQVIMALKN